MLLQNLLRHQLFFKKYEKLESRFFTIESWKHLIEKFPERIKQFIGNEIQIGKDLYTCSAEKLHNELVGLIPADRKFTKWFFGDVRQGMFMLQYMPAVFLPQRGWGIVLPSLGLCIGSTYALIEELEKWVEHLERATSASRFKMVPISVKRKNEDEENQGWFAFDEEEEPFMYKMEPPENFDIMMRSLKFTQELLSALKPHQDSIIKIGWNF